MIFFFFKQKTAYEMRISDWSSDVCSSDLLRSHRKSGARARRRALTRRDQLVQERPLAATIARVEAGRAQGALLHACCSVKHTQRLFVRLANRGLRNRFDELDDLRSLEQIGRAHV